MCSKNISKKCLHKGFGLLILRLGLGVIFFAHGLEKVQMMDGVIAFFGTLGFGPFFAYLVSYLELIGGAALILGIGTRIASGLLAIVMGVVLLYVKYGAPLIGGQSLELDLALFVGLVSMVFLGAGKFSLDRLCKKKCKCGTGCQCKDGVCVCPSDKMSCDRCEGCKAGCTMHEGK